MNATANIAKVEIQKLRNANLFRNRVSAFAVSLAKGGMIFSGPMVRNKIMMIFLSEISP